MDVIEQELVTEMYQELMINVTKMRKRNAEKMKARWDTENTQKVLPGTSFWWTLESRRSGEKKTSSESEFTPCLE